jgi:predicted MFS family arabinose efflux permease
MGETSQNPVQRINNFGIFSLILSRGIANLPSVVVSLLLVDIAASFNVPVGVAGQIRTTAGLLSIIFALVMGVISVRYAYKTLLSLGLILFAVSAIASYFSQSLSTLLIFYSLAGIAVSMVTPMINSLIGALIITENRTKVMGWTIGGLSIIYTLGSLTTAYLASLGWRTTLILVVVPLSLFTCLLCRLQVPNVRQEQGTDVSFAGLFSGYTTLLKNKSALGCILGTVFGLATWNTVLIYGSSYVRQVFGIPVKTMAMVNIIFSLCYTAGSLTASKFTRGLGFKKTLLITTGTLGFFTFFGFNAPNYLLAVLLLIPASFTAGMMITVSSSFSLEQIPEYRGTMMSLHSAAVSMGGTLAAILGGLLLLVYGYSGYSIAMGSLGVFGALVFQFLTIEPKHNNR